MFAFTPATPLSLRPPAPLTISPRRATMRPSTTKRVSMVLSEKETRPVRITGNNVTITEALRAHVNDKLGKVARRFNGIIGKMDVHLTVEHNPSVPLRHKAEVVAFAGKTILRTEVRADDMYNAIDAVEERIGRTIRKFKERKEAKSKSKNGNGVADVVVEEEEDEDDFEDVYAETPKVPPVNAVVKRKVFPMPLQTVEEAVLCCEYLDHPWYIFRSKETGEISLVYKRNHEGYGLIEPSNPDAVDEEPV